MEKVLLIEDDESLGKNLTKRLIEEGLKVEWAKSLKEAQSYPLETFSIILLDWMLPDGQGIDFLKNKLSTPVIMLTARADLLDKVLGLESGASDYITKPFEMRELIARIRVQTRKDSHTHTSIIFERLEIDPLKRTVLFDNESITLTKMEFDLLYLLASESDQVFSREKLLDKVWGYENFPTTRTVDTHVLQLRQKVHSDMINTVRGIGYSFNKSFATKS